MAGLCAALLELTIGRSSEPPDSTRKRLASSRCHSRNRHTGGPGRQRSLVRAARPRVEPLAGHDPLLPRLDRPLRGVPRGARGAGSAPRRRRTRTGWRSCPGSTPSFATTRRTRRAAAADRHDRRGDPSLPSARLLRGSVPPPGRGRMEATGTRVTGTQVSTQVFQPPGEPSRRSATALAPRGAPGVARTEVTRWRRSSSSPSTVPTVR